jgi:hypothetical protein
MPSPPTDSARLYSVWKKLDGTYGDVSPMMTNLSEQYGTKNDFAPEHELEKCDDDTRLAMAKAQARYQVISLGFQHPLSFDQSDWGMGLAAFCICQFEYIAKSLGREDALVPLYEQRIHGYYERYHMKIPSDRCASYRPL